MKTVVRKFIALFSLFVLPFTSLVAAELEFSYIARKASQALFLDIAKSENSRILAVGERGIILFSDDEGETIEDDDTVLDEMIKNSAVNNPRIHPDEKWHYHTNLVLVKRLINMVMT